MDNLFKNAKFGDKFLTKNNHIAVLLGVYDDYVCVCTDDGTLESNINLDGTLQYEPLEGYDYTIVSRYQEPIGEKKLEELAFNECPDTFIYDRDEKSINIFIDAYKAGYRKAKEE